VEVEVTNLLLAQMERRKMRLKFEKEQAEQEKADWKKEWKGSQWTSLTLNKKPYMKEENN
jgi:hypothetical protein